MDSHTDGESGETVIEPSQSFHFPRAPRYLSRIRRIRWQCGHSYWILRTSHAPAARGYRGADSGTRPFPFAMPKPCWRRSRIRETASVIQNKTVPHGLTAAGQAASLKLLNTMPGGHGYRRSFSLMVSLLGVLGRVGQAGCASSDRAKFATGR